MSTIKTFISSPREMIIKVRITMLFMCVFGFANAQEVDTTNMKRRATKQYHQCLKLHDQGKIEEYSKFVHPTILEQIGGKEELLEIDSIVNSNVVKRNISAIGKLYLDYSTCQFAFTEKSITLSSNRDITNSYSVIAISYNSGENWYFFNAYDSIENMRKDIPELNPNLEIIQVPKLDFQF